MNDVAVGFELVDGFLRLLEDFVETGIVSYERHLLHHEVDGALLDAGHLADGILHLGGAVGAIEVFELERLTHGESFPRGLCEPEFGRFLIIRRCASCPGRAWCRRGCRKASR